jgi:hypothetical protein
MSWKPSGLKQRQPRALVVGLRRIVKDPRRRVFGRAPSLRTPGNHRGLYRGPWPGRSRNWGQCFVFAGDGNAGGRRGIRVLDLIVANDVKRFIRCGAATTYVF